MEAQLARQPIFDRDLKVYGFELLFRQSPLENFFAYHDADAAVESLFHDMLHVFGLDRLAPGRRAFVNITEKPLIEGLARRLPKDRVVVELLETIPPTEEVLRECRTLKEEGYLLALDDFVYRQEMQGLVDLADIIKVDFLARDADPAGLPKRLAGKGLTFLAEKVESLEAFQEGLRLGYELFQGNYFQEPEILVHQARAQ